MKILAVDTSGFEGSVAISEGRDVIAQCQLPTEGRRHAQTLVAEVQSLLENVHMAAADIDAVAVSIGPGSFTGLRVGVVFAKTFAWVNQSKLVAVDTLQAIAQRITDSPVVSVISDAQRQEVFLNSYQWDPALKLRIATGPIRIEPIAAVTQSTETLFTGPGLIKFAANFPDGAQLAEESLWRPLAATVAVIGSHLLHKEQFADPYTLEPLYIRRSYAEEKAASKS